MKKIIKYLLSCLIALSYESFAATVDEGVDLFNQQKYKEALLVFEPLAKQGDARALFWLGVSQFQTGEQYEAASTLLQAAEAGNPWAMHLMVPSYNKICDYLGWPCDEGWMDKAIAEWKKRANQGDGKAMYALLRWGEKPWWAYVPILKQKKYGELVEEAVKAGGYKAASYNMYIPIEMEKNIELLDYEAQKGYAPAMMDLHYIRDSNTDDGLQLAKQALSLGYASGAFSLYYYFSRQVSEVETEADIQKMSNRMRQNYKRAYYYSLIGKYFGESDRAYFINQRVINNKGEEVYMSVLSDDEVREVESKAKEFTKDLSINMFIDDSTVGELVAR
ncbi:hypothetical protein [Marinomonas foliarum]|uniref:Sel1 repeat family protein n=1 Tax=Marinomonas foliarum TaxID=491950 RepID=A0ABX7ISG1_9GAMM|nr:hypothetical protein [Marinomonas foliarum]QRV24894.1 hypothetical protein JSY38_04990 [Marinomonas foliarum]